MKYLFAALLLSFFSTAAFATVDPAAPAQAAEKLFQLSYEDAEAAIANALAEKGVAANISATIVGKKGRVLFSYDQPITVEIRGLTYDKPGRRWSASALAISGDKVLTAKPISGRFEEVVNVPVLKRPLRSGEIISENDIEMKRFAMSHTRSGTIMEKVSLIGQSPERSISPNRPVREHEVSGPSLVKKDAIVQMRYAMDGMEITTAGQALADGAKGRMIAVRNLSSKKVVHAVVESENSVSVSPAKTPTQAQAAAAEEHYASN